MDEVIPMDQAAPSGPGRERGDAEMLRIVLERELRSGRWAPGEKLPTERDMCERYGVARNTIRRALQTLEDEHLIIRHVGRGTFRVDSRQSQDKDAFQADGIEAIGPADVMECRLLFEPELASLVVARASQSDLDTIAQCLKGMGAADTVADFEHWDNALHDAIAVATHNQAAISVVRSLAKVRLQAEWGTLKARGMTPERKIELQRQHYAIVAAFRQRDKVEARTLLREHILFVQACMFGE